MRLQRPSPAMVVALIALFVALGGTGYAVVSLPKNSVGAKQLKKNAVSGKKLRKNAVTSSKVKDFSLLAQDFKAGQLPAGSKGDRGDQGPPGPTFGATAMGTPGSPATDPPANPDETGAGIAASGRHFDFALPTGGTVFVRFFSRVWAVDCSAGSPSGGLYLDGVPVPKSSHGITVVSFGDLVEFVAVASAGPGAHSVEARADCPGDATIIGTSDFNIPTWTVILLGG